MPDTQEDFWPSDLLDESVRTPSAILREQALLPGKKTSNWIEGEVRTEAEGDWFVVRFYLVVPVLDNYRYKGVRAQARYEPLPGSNYAESPSTAIRAPVRH
jgi:hypothetical protein